MLGMKNHLSSTGLQSTWVHFEPVPGFLPFHYDHKSSIGRQASSLEFLLPHHFHTFWGPTTIMFMFSQNELRVTMILRGFHSELRVTMILRGFHSELRVTV